jgi:protein-S-isoprenylcysteine O-methyltransferase Ste14
MQHVLPVVLGFVMIFEGGRGTRLHRPLYQSETLRAAGTALTFAGLLFAVWGRVHLGRYWSGLVTLKEGHRLIRTGPYQYVRHPLYTGFLSAILGSAITGGTIAAFAGFVLILVAYLIKMRREEALLTREFGDEYLEFRRSVPQLVPFVR